jgi:tetratricopeptide (TPR) repeat protein
MEAIMRKVCFCLILAALFLGCKSTPKEQTKKLSLEAEAATHFRLGNECYSQHELDRAIAEYSLALEKAPAMAEAHIGRGNAYSGNLEYAQALNDYSAGAEIDAGYDHYARGYSLYLVGDYQSAVDEFSQAIAQQANLVAAYNDRGLAYTNMGNPDRAIADFNEAININNASAFAYNNRGNAYMAKANYGKAIEDYSRAVELHPRLVFPYSGRGFAYHQLGDYSKAIDDYTKAIAITPKDATLYSLRGNAYLSKGEKTRADADFAMATKLQK